MRPRCCWPARRLAGDVLRWILADLLAAGPRRHHRCLRHGRPGPVGRSARIARIRGLESAILDIASLTGLITVTLQIAYLPTLVLGVQPAGDRGGPAERQGRRTELGARAARPHALRPRLGRLHRSTRCPTFTRTGSAGPPTSPRATPRTCRWSGSGPPAAVVLGDRAAGGPRLRGADPVAEPVDSPGRAGPALPAGRLHLLSGDRQGDGLRRPRRAGPRPRHQPHL